ncbi:phosphotransferase enzyme family protein [Streptomyces sp. H39-S7]|uniref:phosphotransferase enzyme family protein n=1 Tax=Streptomyces sp. H39-S7 TaxID=3004357 RepID=UPI0022AF350D|nr:phosphotransferase [Streptomyces sp. H39-S7]MCZ4125428.1 phosphotransferase [Streptomyces sp. H39-S7]
MTLTDATNGADVDLAAQLARTAFGLPVRGGELLGGGATANRCVALTDHNGRPRWVARCPRRDARPGRLDFLLSVHEAAHDLGLPVARPHRTADGSGWVLDRQGRPWMVLDYLPGRTLDPVTANLAGLAAGHLADLHQLPDHLGGSRVVGPDTAWDAWLTAPQETWAAVHDVAGKHRRLLAAYRPHLDRLHRHAGGLPQLTARVWGHGDVHGGNLLHGRGRITGVLDLDGIGRRPRVTDLATGLLMLARAGSGDYRLQPRLLDAVLTGYQQAAPLPLAEAETAALWPAMVLSQLPDRGHLDALRRAGRDVHPALARPLAALRDLTDQQALLTGRFAGVTG